MENKDEEIEIVFGDDSNLNLSDVGDYSDGLKPKTKKEKKNFVIPIAKKKKNDSDKKE